MKHGDRGDDARPGRGRPSRPLSPQLLALGASLARPYIPERVRPYLERMALDRPASFEEKLMRNLVAGALTKLL